jgi:hypothetical protein|tara:strand:- start:48 stop:887 length:840 start_codon:yes stop_codon:yes gene_type:complete
MIAPILSPDGNFLWNGTEWIPNIQSHTQAPQIIEPSSAELNPNDNWKMKFYAKRKIYSGIMMFILLSSILTYFLFPEDESVDTFMPRGYAQDGSFYTFFDPYTDFVEGSSGTMYFVTFRDWRSDGNCNNPDDEKWIDSPNLDHVSDARFGGWCYWIPVENPNFIIFTVERQTDHISKFCFNEGRGTCLFFEEYWLFDLGHSKVIDGNNNCEILVRGSGINYAEFEGGRSEWRDYHALQFNEAKSNDWNKQNTGNKESDTYCNEYHFDGTGPLDQLLEQI